MEEQQQQQIHGSILNAIARLTNPRYREERHQLIVYRGDTGDSRPHTTVDRRSLQRLVEFLDDNDSHEVVITELELSGIRLESDDSSGDGGGLEVLRTFFSRSNTTLTKVTLRDCDFGTTEDASLLLTAIERNRTITDLSIHEIRNSTPFRGVPLGNSFSGLMQNMPKLQRLNCYACDLGVEGVRAFQPSLQMNRTLRNLNLGYCGLGNNGIRLIADALVGNTTIEILIISHNDITSDGLADITRILESTQLKTICLVGNGYLFDDEEATQHFASTLQHKKSSVHELPLIGPNDFPGDEDSQTATFVTINDSLTRNRQLNRVDLLLVPPPQQQQRTNSAASMVMLKTWHKAVTKFAMVPNNAGASAIFKLFQARPQLLEKRLKRPAATASRQQEDSSSRNNDNDSKSGGGDTTSTTTIGGQKRRRL